jgi:hypothetical protein
MHKPLLICTLALAAISTTAQQPSKNIFSGEISDSQCALNVHSKSQSHKEMTANHAMGDTKADCVRTCVKKMGGTYVLLTPEGKVYRLNDQNAPDQFAGERVKVHGTLDKSGTITVEKIEKSS